MISLIYYGRNYENVKKEILYDYENEFEKRNKTSTNYVQVYI